MKQIKILFAFAFGCLAAMALGFGAHARARDIGPRGAAEKAATLESRLAELEQRMPYANGTAIPQQISNKVVAPFVVVDQVGRPIFSVDSSADTATVNVYAGKGLATMSAYGFTAFSPSRNLRAGITAGELSGPQGVFVDENNKNRISFGKGTKGNYRLSFLSGLGKNIAGIGEYAETHVGLALVYDKSGNLRGRMTVTSEGKGIVDVLGTNEVQIAQLTQSEKGGGKLWIGNDKGQGMVEAGDAGGYGIVRAGPKGFEFIPTPGLALPGNVIAGKH